MISELLRPEAGERNIRGTENVIQLERAAPALRVFEICDARERGL
jgi:hypothetical protein